MWEAIVLAAFLALALGSYLVLLIVDANQRGLK
jgi:hypothetical protein